MELLKVQKINNYIPWEDLKNELSAEVFDLFLWYLDWQAVHSKWPYSYDVNRFKKLLKSWIDIHKLVKKIETIATLQIK